MVVAVEALGSRYDMGLWFVYGAIKGAFVKGYSVVYLGRDASKSFKRMNSAVKMLI